jgi:murein DD-endopeptidase MepM/ murein hydrolase activator NlpD
MPALIALTALAGFSTWRFLTRPAGNDELASVRRENARLREINRSFERSLQHLQTRLSEQESRIGELALVAGVERASSRAEGMEPAGAGGVGGTFNPYDQVPDLPALEAKASSLNDRLDLVSRGLTERELRLSARPSLSPVRGVISSGYGYRSDPITGLRAFHRGLDITAPEGNPVVAAADGVVTRAGRFGGQGKVVYIAHGFGFSTRYAHLSKIDVVPGDRVERGDPIGEVGRTGRATGYHVHYEVYEEGQSKNPLEHLLD